jgi:glyoxylase-like metal-dependent hydrolase (beta-lactamase superfamily II)
MRRQESTPTQSAVIPHTWGYHPYENGIPAKGHSMTYLIVGSGGGVLVDPGRGTAHDEVMAFIHGHGFEPDDVAWALLTHCHVDHTGGARPIQAEGIPVAASAFTAQAVKEAALDMGFKDGSRPEMSCEVDRVLEDGEVLSACGMRIRVVATPGHTAGCLSFLVETDEGLTAFTGDLIRDTGQPGWTGSPSFSLEDSIRSIEKLLALGPDKAYWGHGEVEGPAEAWLRQSLDLYNKGRWVMQ